MWDMVPFCKSDYMLYWAVGLSTFFFLFSLFYSLIPKKSPIILVLILILCETFSNKKKKNTCTILSYHCYWFANHVCHMPVARAREIICPVCGLFVWTLNLDWACSTPCLEIYPHYSQIIFFHKYTYYSQGNSQIMCWGLLACLPRDLNLPPSSKV